jgi:hypothetical protein
MDEQRRRYRELRDLLTGLVSTTASQATHSEPSHELQRIYAYLRDHCSVCGASLADADTLVVQGQEVSRVGRVPQSEFADTPICPECYTALRAVRGTYAPGDTATNG